MKLLFVPFNSIQFVTIKFKYFHISTLVALMREDCQKLMFVYYLHRRVPKQKINFQSLSMEIPEENYLFWSILEKDFKIKILNHIKNVLRYVLRAAIKLL